MNRWQGGQARSHVVIPGLIAGLVEVWLSALPANVTSHR
jgi:hypothetical protein